MSTNQETLFQESPKDKLKFRQQVWRHNAGIRKLDTILTRRLPPPILEVSFICIGLSSTQNKTWSLPSIRGIIHGSISRRIRNIWWIIRVEFLVSVVPYGCNHHLRTNSEVFKCKYGKGLYLNFHACVHTPKKEFYVDINIDFFIYHKSS